jgi:hypothetical protein
VIIHPLITLLFIGSTIYYRRRCGRFKKIDKLS